MNLSFYHFISPKSSSINASVIKSDSLRSPINSFNIDTDLYKQNDFHILPNIKNIYLGVIFLDIVNSARFFTHFAENPKLAHLTITRLFAKFDNIIHSFGGCRVKTNGDQYIAVVLPQLNVSLNTVKACNSLIKQSSLPVRVGASFGLTAIGVFDQNYQQIDIWGESVLKAARFESIAKPRQLIIDDKLFSRAKRELLGFEKRVSIIKGVGKSTYYEKQY